MAKQYNNYDNRLVSTSNASSFDAKKNGAFAVIAPTQRRSWKKDFGGAIDHAANLIDAGNADEFLIIKVVARVKRRRAPVDIEMVVN